MLGGFLALIAAATFAFNNASARRGVLTGSALQALAVTVPLGVPIFALAALAVGSLGAIAQFSNATLLALCGAGVVHFIWGRYCNYHATKAIGANLVAPVQQFSLIVSLVMAIVVLGEVLTPLRILGIAMILVGPIFTFKQARSEQPKIAVIAEAVDVAPAIPAFKPRYLEGYLFTLLSAIGYGSSPVMVRFALEDKGVTGALAAGVVSYSAATLVVLLILILPGQLSHFRGMHRESLKWFTISGVLVCISQMFIYCAMAIAPVTVVVPIQRLSIVFRIHAARLLTREHEVFGPGIIAGTVVSLIGAVALSISTEFVLSTLPLPDWIVTVARWHWP